jgi:hypothetical protein
LQQQLALLLTLLVRIAGCISNMLQHAQTLQALCDGAAAAAAAHLALQLGRVGSWPRHLLFGSTSLLYLACTHRLLQGSSSIARSSTGHALIASCCFKKHKHGLVHALHVTAHHMPYTSC